MYTVLWIWKLRNENVGNIFKKWMEGLLSVFSIMFNVEKVLIRGKLICQLFILLGRT